MNDTFYNDELLDLAFHFLMDFSNIYQKEVGRKPTVEELEYSLTTSFVANANDTFLSDFKERKIESVKFKIGKRKKRMKYEVGDICAIPLQCGGYVFSRILLLDKPGWYLSEIFAYYSKDKAYHLNIEKAGNLFYPIFITPSDYDDLNADIIHKKMEGVNFRLDELYYYYGLPGNYKLVKAGKDETSCSIDDAEASKYEKQIFYMPNDILRKIEEELIDRGIIRKYVHNKRQTT